MSSTYLVQSVTPFYGPINVDIVLTKECSHFTTQREEVTTHHVVRAHGARTRAAPLIVGRTVCQHFDRRQTPAPHITQLFVGKNGFLISES